jgi:UDP-GlcNAc:undecaprenyl-phosphate GlcNAc-1-phosphate transferase
METGAVARGCARAFVTALALTPIVRDIFRAYNIVDRPALRKVHAYPIPRLGGIPLIAAFAFGLAGLGMREPALQILPGAAVIFIVGMVDDVFNLPPGFKLAGQIVAAAITFWNGLRFPGPAPLSLAATVFWLALASNAFNLVDGLDGLCAGLGCTAALVLFAMAAIQGTASLAGAALVLAAALLAFLCYNFTRATMFLGDSGALLVGFLLGCLGLMWTRQSGSKFGLLAPLMAIWVPVVDLGLSVVRRWLARRPIFAADRGHIHHRLLDRGLNPAQAVAILHTYGACGGLFAILLDYPPLHPLQALVVAAFLAATWAEIRQLRYAEFEWRKG